MATVVHSASPQYERRAWAAAHAACRHNSMAVVAHSVAPKYERRAGIATHAACRLNNTTVVTYSGSPLWTPCSPPLGPLERGAPCGAQRRPPWTRTHYRTQVRRHAQSSMFDESVDDESDEDVGLDLDRYKVFGVEVLTWTKILPLGLMFFCILFNYTILRDVKDVLVITAPGSGPEVIPFLKVWVDLPVAVAFTAGYSKLANILSAEALFYTVIVPFVIFFGSFAAFMYPNREALHPTAYCNKLLFMLGPSFRGPITILRHWTFSLFYVMAQLWGSVVVSVLFWGFANQITSVEEASQFYPLFGLGANVALIFSGQATKYFSQVRAGLPPGVDGWGVSLNGLMGMVVLAGLFITATYYAMQRLVVPKLPNLRTKTRRVKYKMNGWESARCIALSPYLRSMALLVVTYGMAINLVEVTWKTKIKAMFPNPTDYAIFMGNFSTATGVFTFVIMLLARFIFRRFGWGVAAFITPAMLLLTGVAFFSLQFFNSTFEPMLARWGLTPLYAAVLVGAAQNIFSKSAKYALFDPCKEMAYIPLEDEVKTKGKAAIDVICNPLGKVGGSIIQQALIVCFGSLSASTPYMAGLLLILVLIWMAAASSLDRQFSALCKKMAKAEVDRQQPSVVGGIDSGANAAVGVVADFGGSGAMGSGVGSTPEPLYPMGSMNALPASEYLQASALPSQHAGLPTYSLDSADDPGLSVGGGGPPIRRRSVVDPSDGPQTPLWSIDAPPGMPISFPHGTMDGDQADGGAVGAGSAGAAFAGAVDAVQGVAPTGGATSVEGEGGVVPPKGQGDAVTLKGTKYLGSTVLGSMDSYQI